MWLSAFAGILNKSVCRLLRLCELLRLRFFFFSHTVSFPLGLNSSFFTIPWCVLLCSLFICISSRKIGQEWAYDRIVSSGATGSRALQGSHGAGAEVLWRWWEEISTLCTQTGNRLSKAGNWPWAMVTISPC